MPIAVILFGVALARFLNWYMEKKRLERELDQIIEFVIKQRGRDKEWVKKTLGTPLSELLEE